MIKTSQTPRIENQNTQKGKMTKTLDKAQGIIVAGVGGQGAITLAQLILGAAWRSGYSCLQSEVHGMSQRGGAVNAHIVFDTQIVTSPIIMEGAADVLVGMEPLETLRYVNMVGKGGAIISSISPIKNMAAYPEEETVMNGLKEVPNVMLVDTAANAKTLGNKHAGNMTLLGLASNYIPIENDIWELILTERFQAKGEKVIQKNIEAFAFGRALKNK